MPKQFIRQFPVLLLDMGNTFMYDVDRFGPEQNWLVSYRRHGGRALDQPTLSAAVSDLLDYLYPLLDSPDRIDSFPSIPEAFREMPGYRNWPEEELLILADVVAEHEVGAIPESHRQVIRRFARSHRLGIISNVWADKMVFEARLKEAGLFECFEHLLWSSEHRCIKPSRRLFQMALDRFGITPKETVYIGNSPEKDINGAKTLGIATVWIRNNGAEYPDDCLPPDRIVASLCDL